MNIKEIKDFIKLAKKEGVKELSYSVGETSMSVSFEGSHSEKIIQHAPQPITEAPTPQNKSEDSDSQYIAIKSPFVGTFFTSPSPGEPTYTRVGDQVKKGQVLCIVEAMKIMNEIEADVEGEVMKVCVENESFVEYGQVLFLIKGK